MSLIAKSLYKLKPDIAKPLAKQYLALLQANAGDLNYADSIFTIRLAKTLEIEPKRLL